MPANQFWYGLVATVAAAIACILFAEKAWREQRIEAERTLQVVLLTGRLRQLRKKNRNHVFAMVFGVVAAITGLMLLGALPMPNLS